MLWPQVFREAKGLTRRWQSAQGASTSGKTSGWLTARRLRLYGCEIRVALVWRALVDYERLFLGGPPKKEPRPHVHLRVPSVPLARTPHRSICQVIPRHSHLDVEFGATEPTCLAHAPGASGPFSPTSTAPEGGYLEGTSWKNPLCQVPCWWERG